MDIGPSLSLGFDEEGKKNIYIGIYIRQERRVSRPGILY